MTTQVPDPVGAGQWGAWLALDTSTEQLSVAIQTGEHVLTFVGKGAAQASATLIPAVLNLLAQAGLQLTDLQGIAFGRGPGSFTGLRTACAVAQGLALGAHLPLLPVDTLLAVAEAARHARSAEAGADPVQPLTVLAMLDARMGEVYAATWRWTPAADWAGAAQPGTWSELEPAHLASPLQALARAQALVASHATDPAQGALLAAGNALGLGLEPWPGALPQSHALPMADAMLRLVPQGLRTGQLVDAQDALPLYIRDKVAKTTEERQRERFLHERRPANPAAPI
jgi:tRNA threonylcarbamoyladenosine biosynthesis protein TsaB